MKGNIKKGPDVHQYKGQHPTLEELVWIKKIGNIQVKKSKVIVKETRVTGFSFSLFFIWLNGLVSIQRRLY